MSKTKCLMGIDPAQAKKCNASECQNCGWEMSENERRRAYLKKYGLTLCADGLRRLIIRKELFNMAKPYRKCPFCGAHLDSGEKCDCAENRNENKNEATNNNYSKEARNKGNDSK